MEQYLFLNPICTHPQPPGCSFILYAALQVQPSGCLTSRSFERRNNDGRLHPSCFRIRTRCGCKIGPGIVPNCSQLAPRCSRSGNRPDAKPMILLRKLVGAWRFELQTSCAQGSCKKSILLVRLALFCVMVLGFGPNLAVVGPKLDPTFFRN